MISGALIAIRAHAHDVSCCVYSATEFALKKKLAVEKAALIREERELENRRKSKAAGAGAAAAGGR